MKIIFLEQVGKTLKIRKTLMYFVLLVWFGYFEEVAQLNYPSHAYFLSSLALALSIAAAENIIIAKQQSLDPSLSLQCPGLMRDFGIFLQYVVDQKLLNPTAPPIKKWQ